MVSELHGTETIDLLWCSPHGVPNTWALSSWSAALGVERQAFVVGVEEIAALATPILGA